MRLILFALSLVLFASCEKETIVRYEVSLDAEFDIPIGLNTIETHYFIVKNVPTFYKQSANNRNVDTSGILNVLASRGLIRAKFLDRDWDFVERVSVYGVSKIDPTLKREMYYIDFVPINTGKELRMLSSTTELKKLMSEEFIDLEIRLNFRSFNTAPLRARIEFGYAVF